jgi:putative membrane protein
MILTVFCKTKPIFIMKKQINFKSTLWLSICLAGTVFLASSCSENRTTDSMDVAEEENVNNLTTDRETAVVIEEDHDIKFLMKAAEMQVEEINLGKLAQQKGNSPHVKELGKMMETEHSKTLEELKALAQANSVAIPTTLTEDSQDSYEKLQKETGKDFDEDYTELMVDKHEEAIDLFEKAAEDAENPEIRNWAQQKLPALRTHLEHAKASKEQSEKNNS